MQMITNKIQCFYGVDLYFNLTFRPESAILWAGKGNVGKRHKKETFPWQIRNARNVVRGVPDRSSNLPDASGIIFDFRRTDNSATSPC